MVSKRKMNVLKDKTLRQYRFEVRDLRRDEHVLKNKVEHLNEQFRDSYKKRLEFLERFEQQLIDRHSKLTKDCGDHLEKAKALESRDAVIGEYIKNERKVIEDIRKENEKTLDKLRSERAKIKKLKNDKEIKAKAMLEKAKKKIQEAESIFNKAKSERKKFDEYKENENINLDKKLTEINAKLREIDNQANKIKTFKAGHSRLITKPMIKFG